jgi:hypothetical protein
MNLSSRVKITKVSDPSTAATSAVESTGVDMAGYEGVVFVTSFGTAAANNTAKVAQGADNSADWEDLTGTSVASGTSDEDVWIDVYRPSDRYVRLEVARGTSTTLGDIWAIQYGPRTMPADNTASGTVIGEFHQEPAEGTA